MATKQAFHSMTKVQLAGFAREALRFGAWLKQHGEYSDAAHEFISAELATKELLARQYREKLAKAVNAFPKSITWH